MANISVGNGMKKPPQLFAGDAVHYFWFVNRDRQRGPSFGIDEWADGGEMDEGQRRMATPNTDQTSLLEGKSTLSRMKICPGTHLDYLEAGQDASSAVRLLGPHLDPSLFGKTCRIRFCSNDERLQPGPTRVMGTRPRIPVSPRGGTTETPTVPCLCSGAVGFCTSGAGVPRLHPPIHAGTGGKSHFLLPVGWLNKSCWQSTKDSATPVPLMPRVPRSTDSGFCQSHRLIKPTFLQINLYEFSVASAFLISW